MSFSIRLVLPSSSKMVVTNALSTARIPKGILTVIYTTLMKYDQVLSFFKISFPTGVVAHVSLRKD